MTPDRTALYGWHLLRNGRMVPFGGWEMPVQYAGVLPEHAAVRTGAGLFDISHMARFEFAGPAVLEWLEWVSTNAVANMRPGQIRYSLLCNELGCTIDDVLVYRWPDRWGMVANAGNRAKVAEWLMRHAPPGATLIDRTPESAMIALQGPKALEMAEGLFSAPVGDMRYYFGREDTWGDVPVRLSRTGYTGEDGFEVILPNADAVAFADELLKRGAVPCGLGARDTLRLEAGMPLYGHELSEVIDPLQAGLAWAVKFEGREFVGREALLARSQQNTLPTRVGLRVEGKRSPRAGNEVRKGVVPIGVVTTGSYSPTLDCSIASAFLTPGTAGWGEEVVVDVRGTDVLARVCELPFYKRSR